MSPGMEIWGLNVPRDGGLGLNTPRSGVLAAKCSQIWRAKCPQLWCFGVLNTPSCGGLGLNVSRDGGLGLNAPDLGVLGGKMLPALGFWGG